MSLEILSGKLSYLEEIDDYSIGDTPEGQGGAPTKWKVAQGEEDMSFTNLAIRMGKTTPVLTENLSAGIEKLAC